MVRKFAQVTLAVFLVLALAGMAHAAAKTPGSVANVSQKGSLLIFPKVTNVGGYTAPTVYTNIYIGNDFRDGTYVKCYWMDHNQYIEDFHFRITANQPIVFSTYENNYGPPFAEDDNGSLFCWAQDSADQFPVVWNYLYGTAMIVNTVQKANIFYNATAFYLRSVPATAGRLPLDGNTFYDRCAAYLTTDFIPDNATMPTPQGILTKPHPELTVIPCYQDLRQDRTPSYIKLSFDIWNWDEVKFTGSYQCVKCFWEGVLTGITYGGEKFTHYTLGGPTKDELVARMRVTSVTASKCWTPPAQPWILSGLVGVLLYKDADGLYPVAGHVLAQSGQFAGSDAILYDPAGGYDESAGK